jgi:hypothetical protein
MEIVADADQARAAGFADVILGLAAPAGRTQSRF